jgi:oligopeptide/dipeptide ABC transporter ATP-binding protein
MSAPNLLEVHGLTLEIKTKRGAIRPVQDVTFTLAEGESLALVGESGCGKTLTLRSILRLLPRGASIVAGSIILDGTDITGLNAKEFRTLVRGRIGIVFQEPLRALNPVMRVGDQVSEGPRVRFGIGREEARSNAIDLMAKVGIPDPERRSSAYPHELSGGMRQRVMIAIALASQPRILLCDEPTTALDVTIQDQILKLLAGLRQASGLSLVLVTHDLAVVAETCPRVAVMYAGRIVETGPTANVLTDPRHSYTLQLLRSVPDVATRGVVEPIRGAPPDPLAFPPGCRFHPRCSLATSDCQVGEFPLTEVAASHFSACIHHLECAASNTGRAEGEARPARQHGGVDGV